MRIQKSSRTGVSLMEVVAAVVISSMLAIAGFSLTRDRSEVAHSRTCEGHRVSLQSMAELYQQENGRWPDTNLRGIATTDYAGETLPHCPEAIKSGETNYRIRNGKVVCQFHPEE